MNWIKFVNFFSPARSEIAENGADKVLSSEEDNSSVHKAYVNFPTSRKSALDVPLYAISSGRSMVEMLGVLAIIGVLSVGAMTGYSKAMFKYKLNRQTEQMNTIINAIVRYQADIKLNDGSVDFYQLVPLLKKLHEIPEDMYVKNNDEIIEDVFSTQYRVYHHSTGYLGVLTRISESNESVEICKNLYLIAKEYHASIYSVLVSNRSTENPVDDYVYGDKGCKSGKTCLRNMNLNEITDRCRICEQDALCYLIYIFW